MARQRIRLTESQLNRVIKESVKRVIKESDFDGNLYTVTVKIGGTASQVVSANSPEEALRLAIQTPDNWGSYDYHWQWDTDNIAVRPGKESPSTQSVTDNGEVDFGLLEREGWTCFTN